MTTLSVSLPAELASRLQDLSIETDNSVEFYILRAIERQIEDLEDIYLAEKAVMDLRAGRTTTLTLEEVKRELGLED